MTKSGDFNLVALMRENTDQPAFSDMDAFISALDGDVKTEFTSLHRGHAYFNWDSTRAKLISVMHDVVANNAKPNITSHMLIDLHEQLDHGFRRGIDTDISRSNATQVAMSMAIKAQFYRKDNAPQDSVEAANAPNAPSVAA